jgi:TolB-like protein
VAQLKTPEPAEAIAAASAAQSMDKAPLVETAINDASIAVLPFADLAPGGDQEYFSDGIAEEILNVLARVDGLAVVSRTSAFADKGQEQLGIPAIGAALRARHVFEGSVQEWGHSCVRYCSRSNFAVKCRRNCGASTIRMPRTSLRRSHTWDIASSM